MVRMGSCMNIPHLYVRAHRCVDAYDTGCVSWRIFVKECSVIVGTTDLSLWRHAKTVTEIFASDPNKFLYSHYSKRRGIFLEERWFLFNEIIERYGPPAWLTHDRNIVLSLFYVFFVFFVTGSSNIFELLLAKRNLFLFSRWNKSNRSSKEFNFIYKKVVS